MNEEQADKQGVTSMQTVYLVRGSEDGHIGVFGSVSKAQRCAERYIERQASSDEMSELSAMRKGDEHVITMYADEEYYGMSAEIKAATLNYDPSNI
jgi:hypothetical protein